MILVTGATGNVGLELVKILADKGAAMRIVTRDKSKATNLPGKVEILEGDIGDKATVQRAMRGVDALYLFPVIFDLTHRSTRLLVDEAKAAGVKRIVMLSSMAADHEGSSDLARLHREKEILIEKSEISWTFVRPTGFMSNSLQWLPTIQAQGKVFSATGDGRMPLISPFDIAAVSAEALTGKGHENKIYSLTGPELMTAKEQVAVLSKAIGQPLECVEVPAEAIAGKMAEIGLPPFLIESMKKMWARVKSGGTEFQSKDLEEITGSKGETFAQWCANHRHQFAAKEAVAGKN